MVGRINQRLTLMTMTDLSDLMAETTRLLLAFLLGMLTGPLFYVIHVRRMRR